MLGGHLGGTARRAGPRGRQPPAEPGKMAHPEKGVQTQGTGRGRESRPSED